MIKNTCVGQQKMCPNMGNKNLDILPSSVGEMVLLQDDHYKYVLDTINWERIMWLIEGQRATRYEETSNRCFLF